MNNVTCADKIEEVGQCKNAMLDNFQGIIWDIYHSVFRSMIFK